MPSLNLTPREDLLAVRSQAATAPSLAVPPTSVPVPRPLPQRPPSINALLSDATPTTDYATEVEALIRASRHPASISAGLVAGVACGALLYRRRKPQQALGHVIPVAGGLLGGSVAHGAASWALYRSASTTDTASKTTTTPRVSDGGGLWSTAVSLATIVGVVGGGLYLYDRYHKPRSRARLSDTSAKDKVGGHKNSASSTLKYSVWIELDKADDEWTLLDTVATPTEAVRIALRAFNKAKKARTVVIEDWESIVALTPDGLELYGHPEEKHFLPLISTVTS